MITRTLPLWLFVICCAACSSDDPPYHLTFDGSTSSDIAVSDLVPHTDVYQPPNPDGGAEDTGCLLGTVDNCSACGDPCFGEDEGTLPVCLDNACAIQCKEEYYDANGFVTDGCETADDLPIHDTQETSFYVGEANDCDEAHAISGVLPSDDRLHVTDPSERPNGRTDWYSIKINDGGCIVQGQVTVSFENMPQQGSYRAVATYVCEDGTELAPDSKLASGGESVFLAPSISCSGLLGDDTGFLFIKVSKESGPHSAAAYTILVEP